MRSALLLVFLVSDAAAADRARLGGRVQDSSRAVLVDVAVVAVNEDTGIRRTVRTDGAGEYAIGALDPGLYKVTARKPGFQTVARLNVEVAPARQARLDFVMPVGSMHDVMTVEAATEDPRRDGGSAGVTAYRRMIDTLPLDGRGVLTLLELAPGVVATPASAGEAGQFSVNGQRANTNYFSLDGVSANTGVTGSAAPAQFSGGALPSMTAFGGLQNLASLDSLQEVRVETSSFAPESGRMPGAQVWLATRSGSNDWHGSLAYGLRNEKLAANDWFAGARGYPRAPLRLNQMAGTVGGPVRRDRTFFFASWEALRLRAPFAWLAATPSLALRQSAAPPLDSLVAAFPLPTGHDLGGGLSEYTAHGSSPSRLDSGSLRIDHALTGRVALFGRYSQAPSSTQFGYQRVEDAAFRTHSLTLGVNALLGGGITSDARIKTEGDSVAARWLTHANDGAHAFDLVRLLGPLGSGSSAIYGISIGGVGQILSGATEGNRQGQLHLVEGLGFARGTHTWRAGVEYQRLTPSRGNPAVAVAGMWPSLSALLAGTPMQIATSQADRASSLIEALSVYFQDTWRPTSRLALTYGVRWEITPAPSIRQGVVPVSIVNPADSGGRGTAPPSIGVGSTVLPVAAASTSGPLWPTRYGQVAPRAGAAYRLTDRSVLRAGWGIFYDLGFSAVTDPINGFPFNRWQFGDILATSGPSSGTAGLGFATNLRLPYSHEWNVAWENAVFASDLVAVSYTGSAGRRLLRREAGIQFGGAGATASIATNHGASDFHALEVEYRRRLARGFEGVANYSWSHSIDNGSWDSAVSLITADYAARNDRASSSFDVRHSFSGALMFESRGLGRAGLWRHLTSDWKMQAIGRARSAFPIDILETENALGLGWDNYRRPDLAPGVPMWISDASVLGGRRLNPAAFVAPAGLQGSLGRNAVRGFGMFQADLAMRRRFPLGDSASVEVGVACFNAFNHANAGDPVRYRNSPFFGEPVSILSLMLGNGSPRSGLTPVFQLGGPRSAEIGIKVRF